MKSPETWEKVVWPGSTQLAPIPAVLVGCGDGSAEMPYNLLTVAWAGIVCSAPPMIGISVRPERFSYPILRKQRVFTVNIPTAAMARSVDYCGVASGRDTDKFAACGLTPVRGGKVSAPLVRECPMSLECEVRQELELGAHTLFLAEIVAVQALKSLLDSKGRFQLEKAGLLAYVHGHYHLLGKEIGHFGYSVRKRPAATRKKRSNEPKKEIPSHGKKSTAGNHLR